MSGARTVLGIAGSLRQGSYNRALVRAAAELAPEGADVRVWDGLREVPPYDQDADVEPAPEPVADLRRVIDEADAVLFATPEYNHSVPGVLKNVVDWASRPYGESVLIGKPTAVVGASPSRFGARWAQEDLKRVLQACEAEVLEEELPVDRAAERIEDGQVVDGAVREELAEILRALIDLTASGTTVDAGAEPSPDRRAAGAS